MKAVSPPHSAVVCDYSIDEMRRVYNRKFPSRISDFEQFISGLALSVEIISVPVGEESVEGEKFIRDLNDGPIFRAAVAAGVNGIITGDKDFLESGIKSPKMISSAEFLRML